MADNRVNQPTLLVSCDCWHPHTPPHPTPPAVQWDFRKSRLPAFKFSIRSSSIETAAAARFFRSRGDSTAETWKHWPPLVLVVQSSSVCLARRRACCSICRGHRKCHNTRGVTTCCVSLAFCAKPSFNHPQAFTAATHLAAPLEFFFSAISRDAGWKLESCLVSRRELRPSFEAPVSAAEGPEVKPPREQRLRKVQERPATRQRPLGRPVLTPPTSSRQSADGANDSQLSWFSLRRTSSALMDFHGVISFSQWQFPPLPTYVFNHLMARGGGHVGEFGSFRISYKVKRNTLYLSNSTGESANSCVSTMIEAEQQQHFLRLIVHISKTCFTLDGRAIFKSLRKMKWNKKRKK